MLQSTHLRTRPGAQKQFAPARSPGLTASCRLSQAAMTDTVKFRGKGGIIDEAFRAEVKKILQRELYHYQDECFTVEDFLRAMKKASRKKLRNPMALLFIALGGTDMMGWKRAYWVATSVEPQEIVNNMPLKYGTRAHKEEGWLLGMAEVSLKCMETIGLVGPGINDRWELTPKADVALQVMDAIPSRQRKLTAPPAEATPMQNQAATEDPQQLKANFEAQIQQILAKQQRVEQDTLDTRARLERETVEANELQLKAAGAGASLLTHVDLKNKLALVEALTLQLKVAETFRDQHRDELEQIIASVKTAINHLELTQVRAKTLEMTGKLKEKQELDATLALQMAEVQQACQDIQAALAAENPEAYIALIRQVRLVTAPEAPTTLKFDAASLPAATEAPQALSAS